LDPEISIIVLTKNGERYIAEVLEAITNQASQHAFEVLLIDSGSTDGTWEIAHAFPIRTYRIPPQDFNHGETRNLGARLASPTTNYLVYLTQDATPLEHWLDCLIRPLKANSRIAGTFSRHIPRPTCSPSMARLMCTEWEQTGTAERVVKCLTDLDVYERNQAYFAHFSNTSSAIRRAVWEEHPFRPLEFAEDSEWADRILRAGYALIYEPSSRVLHSHEYSLWQQFAQNVDHAMAMKQLHNPPQYANSHPSRALRRISERVRKDLLYISDLQISTARKARWYIHAPLWQLATEAGAHIGARADKLPLWMRNRLSRQAHVRRR
jgi:rhamnosyltransferase